MIHQCRETSNRKIFVYEECRSKLTLINSDEIDSVSIKVDGCEINDDSVRCDFLHIAKEIEYFIELKGQDLKHAQKQLIESFKRLSVDFQQTEKIAIIICSRSPLSATEIQNIKMDFKRRFNSSLIIKSSPYSIKY